MAIARRFRGIVAVQTQRLASGLLALTVAPAATPEYTSPYGLTRNRVAGAFAGVCKESSTLATRGAI
jgi:hypothetical protein